jgi:hypothetical protein
MAIASLIIGLAAIVAGLQSVFISLFHIRLLSFFGTGNVFLFPLTIVGLVLGIIAVRKKPSSGAAVAGIILNALVVLFFLAIFITWGIKGD